MLGGYDWSVQTYHFYRQVKEIVKPARYVGVDHLYDLDIALLVLTQSVTLNNYIIPACVDWSGAMGPEHNEVGYVSTYSSFRSNDLLQSSIIGHSCWFDSLL